MMTNREDQASRKNFALPLHALAMLVLILVLGSQRAVVAQQWTTNGNNINNTNTGNVGVGTSNPQATLQVSTSSTAVSTHNHLRKCHRSKYSIKHGCSYAQCACRSRRRS